MRIVASEGARYEMNFDPGSAVLSFEDTDLVLSFENGGKIVFERLIEMAASPDPPIFLIQGVEVASTVLASQVSALALGPDAAHGSLFASPDGTGFAFAPFPELRRARLGR